MALVWRVKFDEPSWHADLIAASQGARRQATSWRRRIEMTGGKLAHEELLRCDPADDQSPLPRCVKTRIPDPTTSDIRTSPWGAVLQIALDEDGPYLEFVAFGLRHPDAGGSQQPSVYERAARRV